MNERKLTQKYNLRFMWMYVDKLTPLCLLCLCVAGAGLVAVGGARRAEGGARIQGVAEFEHVSG